MTIKPNFGLFFKSGIFVTFVRFTCLNFTPDMNIGQFLSILQKMFITSILILKKDTRSVLDCFIFIHLQLEKRNTKCIRLFYSYSFAIGEKGNTSARNTYTLLELELPRLLAPDLPSGDHGQPHFSRSCRAPRLSSSEHQPGPCTLSQPPGAAP